MASIEALCLDGIEYELAITIVSLQRRIVKRRGFDPEIDDGQLSEITERVLSAISYSFSTYYGAPPCDRYEDVYIQIADFASHLAKDHIFHDGNKRTTTIISLSLLSLSGAVLQIEDINDPEQNEVYEWIQDVVTEGRTVDDLADWLRRNSVIEEDMV